MSTYVYGITAATHPSLPEGTGGVGDPPREVRILKEGELAAVVSDAPEGLRPKRRELLAHQNVLSEIGADGCVLPMRFGSVAPDDEAVTGVLAERAEHYAERLKALDGRVEYNIKANHVEEAVLHHVMASNPEIRALAESNRQAGGGTSRRRSSSVGDDTRDSEGSEDSEYEEPEDRGEAEESAERRAPRRGERPAKKAPSEARKTARKAPAKKAAAKAPAKKAAAKAPREEGGGEACPARQEGGRKEDGRGQEHRPRCRCPAVEGRW
ncbi:hypothetical protein STENM327S_08637 [Streptomyces tendae]